MGVNCRAMKTLTFLMPAILLSLNSFAETPKAQMSCTAIFRTLDKNGNTVERSLNLPVEGTIGDQIKHRGDFEGKSFSLIEDRISGDLFGQIITNSDDTKGTVFRGAADSVGRFNATEVIGFTVYRMECSRIRN